jgi:hypothetical protein
MAKNDIKLEIGLTISKGDWAGAQWTITGNPKESMTVRKFESAYDFEEFIQKNISCKGIEFDSEYCQFFAYAKTKASAIAFGNRIEKYFEKVRKYLKINLVD